MRRAGWTLGVLLLVSSSAYTAPPEQWIVVTAPAFRESLEPLCEHRKEQRLRVRVVQTTDVLSPAEIRSGDAHKLRDHIHKLCRAWEGPSYVLLVGGSEAGRLSDAEKKVLPPLPGTVGRMKGQPTDNAYGCLDGGFSPTVAIGRFPARTVEEARGMVGKTLEYERDARPGRWRRRLTILAGIPAYNAFVDRMVESLALARFERLSPCWTGRAIYSNPQSRFCLPDDLLHKRAVEYVEEGEAFTLYLGHSSAEGLYGGQAAYLDREDWSKLHIGRGKGVFVTFGCNGCQLTGSNGEGYGVAAVRNPNGPAAVIGSHGICFASMVQLGADGLFESTFADRPPERLGESWLAVKKGVARGKIDDFTYRLLDAVDGDKQIPQATQRLEHLEMFLLLGDPALRIPAVPEDIELNADAIVVPGAVMTVRGKAPARLEGAEVRLTLERTVNSVPEGLQAVPKDRAERDRILLANHERANRFVLTESQSVVKDGAFEAKLVAPAKLPWPGVILRACAATAREEGIATRTVKVRQVAKRSN
jgi:hypothetical protein